MTDIAGYTFAADIWCPDCIIDRFMQSYAPNVPDDVITAEAVLDAVAETKKIDRYNETTFDSSDFPKVICGAHEDCTKEEGCIDRCGQCGEELDGGCWTHWDDAD